jgi:hypothetical protein
MYFIYVIENLLNGKIRQDEAGRLRPSPREVFYVWEKTFGSHEAEDEFISHQNPL